jgi:hypothetical protein
MGSARIVAGIDWRLRTRKCHFEHPLEIPRQFVARLLNSSGSGIFARPLLTISGAV